MWLFCLNRRLWLAIQIFVCLFICKSSPMIYCGNRNFLEVTWQMFQRDVRELYIRKTARFPL
jgi:hypothetical protein